jgi:hypothetical protein
MEHTHKRVSQLFSVSGGRYTTSHWLDVRRGIIQDYQSWADASQREMEARLARYPDQMCTDVEKRANAHQLDARVRSLTQALDRRAGLHENKYLHIEC